MIRSPRAGAVMTASQPLSWIVRWSIGRPNTTATSRDCSSAAMNGADCMRPIRISTRWRDGEVRQPQPIVTCERSRESRVESAIATSRFDERGMTADDVPGIRQSVAHRCGFR